MNNKEIIKEVKKLFNFNEEELAFLDVKTSDGLVLRVAKMEEGEVVTLISEDGENVSGEADYTLEDGTMLVVDAEGTITAITVAEEEDEEVEEEMSEVEDEVNPLEGRIANLEEGIEKVLSMFSTQIEELEAKDLVVKELTEKVEAFSKAPAEDEIVVKKKTPLEEKRYNAINELRNFNKTKK